MTTNIITLNPNDNLLKVEEIFKTNDFHHIPIVNKENEVKGARKKGEKDEGREKRTRAALTALCGGTQARRLNGVRHIAGLGLAVASGATCAVTVQTVALWRRHLTSRMNAVHVLRRAASDQSSDERP